MSFEMDTPALDTPKLGLGLGSPRMSTIMVFIISTLALYYTQPSPIFDKKGNMKKFGIGKNKTCFSFAIVIGIITIISYFVLTILYSINNN